MIKTEGFSKELKFKESIAMAVRKFKIGKMDNPRPVVYIVLYRTQELIIQSQGDIRTEI